MFPHERFVVHLWKAAASILNPSVLHVDLTPKVTVPSPFYPTAQLNPVQLVMLNFEYALEPPRSHKTKCIRICGARLFGKASQIHVVCSQESFCCLFE